MPEINVRPFLLGKDFVAYLFVGLKIQRWKQFLRRAQRQKLLPGKFS